MGRVPGDPELFRLLGAFPPQRRPVLLDSVAGDPRRVSVLGFDPVVRARGDRLVDLRGLLARLQSDPARPGDPLPECEGAFRGGFLGALAYDLGSQDEELDLPPEPWGFPTLVGGLYTDYLLRDEVTGTTWCVLGEDPGDGRPPVAERRAALERAWSDLPPPGAVQARGPLERCVSSAEHQARVRAAQEAIAAGEIYQANLAHRLTRGVRGRPEDLYRRLRRANPAPFMGYLAFEEGAVLSSSPELLLAFEPGREARSRPIKGTIARHADADRDAEQAERLLASEKDRAELAMIVDLVRNDLGRVAEVGSVRVEGFPRLESYAAVHHLVADVRCTPRAGTGALDALGALFPGGSISGAPKLRSMEVIAELEGEGRGFFTGSLGFLDLGGRARFNILIRTLLWRPAPGAGEGAGEVSFRVGGGITWASDPAAEDAETLAKAQALAAALEGPAGV